MVSEDSSIYYKDRKTRNVTSGNVYGKILSKLFPVDPWNEAVRFDSCLQPRPRGALPSSVSGVIINGVRAGSAVSSLNCLNPSDQLQRLDQVENGVLECIRLALKFIKSLKK